MTASLRFGRLRSGPAWPPGLARLDRFAAAPAPAAAFELPGEAALLFETKPGSPRALCAKRPDGAAEWSVDPEAWIRAILAEDYVEGWRRPLPSRVPWFNYSRAPFALKGALARLQDPSREAPAPPLPFPELPIDDLVDLLRALRSRLVGAPERPAEPWPDGARAAVAVTHDADSGWILDPARADRFARVVEGEAELGFPGCWYLVAEELRLPAHEPALRRLRDAGHELGAHGWNHDGRLAFLEPAQQEERMERIARRFHGLGVRGMRTPWYARSASLFDAIARRFAYDSSVPNATGFYSTRTRSGCCTLFPYEARPGLVELPMTLPPDTAVPIERRQRVLGELADAIIERGGVVVATFHPQPHQSASAEGIAAHLGFLRDLRERHGASLWCATPAEIVERHREPAPPATAAVRA